MLDDLQAMPEPDLEWAREKYKAERDRRSGKSNRSAYRTPGSGIAIDLRDTYRPRIEREVRNEQVDAVIIGAGFAGLIVAIEMKKCGIGPIRIIDTAGDFGGVWYWNRYPGAQCDVESYIYLPFLEETGYIPKEKYSHQPEILEHAQRLGRHFDLYDDALFHTGVTDVRWSDSDRWTVTTDRGDTIRSNFVVMAGGGQDQPRLPDLPGLDEFSGHVFHSCRWDYDYSGGSHAGDCAGLEGKRVAVVGTGASAVQLVPYIARSADHLYVLQRTPVVVGERLNKPTDPAWAASLEPGWQDRRMLNYSTLVLGGQQDEDLVDDGWTHATAELASVYGGDKSDSGVSADEAAEAAERADLRYMEKIRARVDRVVTKREKAALLKPWYRYFCKRPTFNDLYLPAFNRDNVELLDVSGPAGLERLTKAGFVVDGAEYPADAIIFASGFASDLSERKGYELTGRGGISLRDHWQEGARSLHGVLVHNFPNLFLMGTVHVGLTINYTEMMMRQGRHIARTIELLRARGFDEIEATAGAEDAYVEEIVAGREADVAFHASCTPGYFNNEGMPVKRGKGLTDTVYAGGLFAWVAMVTDWRETQDFAGAELR
ncbi:NAD(P)/FAD-dependent oxidoreductase [Sphingopyxis sp. KK2]|uniref:flavin-containing monooxygenase n=1 Tax=Sphingopyxis sp. KK2 TaxID=1855727 RepID=UPI00097E6B1E|nr:NAD(P)/FAD-dependent oxidoreductase [Sphingopyxis sp. KK2]